MDERLSAGLTVLLIAATVTTGVGVAQSTADEAATSIVDLRNEQVNIELQSQRRTVDDGEPIILDLSAVSYVTNEKPITLQLIVESSSGVAISKTTAQRGGGNQFSTVAVLEPGATESVRVLVDPSEPGTYEITAEVVYFVGDDRDSGTGERTSIEITQNPPPKGLFWWTPTILGIGTSAALFGVLFWRSAADRITRWNGVGEFISTESLVVLSGVAIYISGWWFSSYAEGVSSPGVVGSNLAVMTVITGSILALVGYVGDFSDKIRVLYGYTGATVMFAIPLQLAFSLIGAAISGTAIQF
jgi:hypothetical protein